jgi:hypothetical protein
MPKKMYVRDMRSAWLLCAVLASSSALLACGGNKESVTAQTPGKAVDLDADPVALLPGSAVAVASLDARAFFASPSFGPQLAQAAEKYFPIGQEAGFSPSRDLTRITCGSYAMQGADVACVLTGTFDPARVQQMADQHVQVKSGGMLVASSYAGRTLYTINNIGFTVLTPKTVLAGTETGIRRALDRVAAGRVQRDIAPWMGQTLDTQGAPAALAADFGSQQVPQNTGVPLPVTQGLRSARVLANFGPPGLNVAGSLTYPDPQTATNASQAIQAQTKLLAFLPLFGVQVKQFNVAVAQNDVQITVATDDQSLRNLLQNAPRFMGQ